MVKLYLIPEDSLPEQIEVPEDLIIEEVQKEIQDKGGVAWLVTDCRNINN